MSNGRTTRRPRPVDPRARNVARSILTAIVVVDGVLVATNWRWFTAPVPKRRFGVVGQLVGGSPAAAFVLRLAVITLVLSVIGSIFGLMLRGQLLSRFGHTEAEPPPTEPLERMEATDTDIDARLESVEDAVKDLIEFERRKNEEQRGS